MDFLSRDARSPSDDRRKLRCRCPCRPQHLHNPPGVSLVLVSNETPTAHRANDVPLARLTESPQTRHPRAVFLSTTAIAHRRASTVPSSS